MSGLDADFVTYYDAEAAARARRDLGELRTTLQGSFCDLLTAEGRTAVVDVGAGPGLDLEGFVARGVSAVGVELAPGNVGLMYERGLTGVVGSIHALPIGGSSCQAVWTMSTFVHVPDERLDEALAELMRVAVPGAPVGIGTWGGRNWDGTLDFTRFQPPRFFALRSHDRWRATLARFGPIDRFETFATGRPGWDYQFAVVRRVHTT